MFQNTAIANIGDAGGLRGSVSAGNFYIALYTVTPATAHIYAHGGSIHSVEAGTTLETF